MGQERLTIRLRPAQMQTLRELRDELGVSCSLIVRSIIFDFLSRNEDALERIIVAKKASRMEEEEEDEEEVEEMEEDYWEGAGDSWNRNADN